MKKEIKATQILSEDEQKKRAFAKVIIDNILFLANKKGISKSDLEREAGISAGYISRLSRPENTTVPNVEVLLAFSKKLGVTVDYLVNPRTNNTSENEELLIKFLNKVSDDTVSRDIEWTVETPEELGKRNWYDYETGECGHPLFREYEKPKPWSTDYPEYESGYISYFGDQCLSTFLGDCYHAELPYQNAKLYIMNIETSYFFTTKEGQQFDDQIDCFEVCLYKDGVEPLCRTDLVSEDVDDAVRKLYYTIKREMDSNKLSKKAKDILETYVGDKLPF